MKRKLLFAIAALLCSVGSWGQTVWSGDITNADGLSFTTKYANPSNHDVSETWTNTSSTTHAFDVNQSLTSVPDGVYELSAQAMYRASKTYGTTTNCVLYATVGETTFSTPIANFADYTAKEDRAQIGTQMQNNNAYLNIVPAVIVEGGNVTIGMKNVGELAYCTNGYWFVFKKSTFTFKNVTTTYHAKLVARATTMLATAPASAAKTTLSDALTTYATANFANVKALQAAINTFLETATVEYPLNVTDYITNPSFSDDSGNKKNWIQDLGYTQASEIYQPTGWNMLYSSAKVGNTAYQTYKTQTGNAKDNNCYYVRQKWSDVAAVVSLHQLVKELPAGAYRLTVAVKGGSSVTDANTLGMKAGSNSNTASVSDFDKSNYKDYSVQVNKTNANEDIDISFAWNQTSSGNPEQLYYVDDFRLYYLGDPVKVKKAELEALQATITDEAYFNNAAYTNVVGTERTNLTTQKTATAASETVEAYQAVIDATQEAIDAFVAAKTNYDALAREITKSAALGFDGSMYAATSSTTSAIALSNTQSLKVNEYTYVTSTYQYGVSLGEWTTEGYTSDNSGQHWDGTGTNGSKYKEQENSWGTPKKGYAADSWSIKFYQSIELPAGNYVFKVAGRKASGTHTTMSLDVTKTSDDSSLGSINDFPEGDTGLGINKDGVTSFDSEDAAGFANNGAGRGWEWRYVKFTLPATTEVKIAVNADADAASQWMSFCNYTLQTDDNTNISLIAYNIALGSAQTVLADGTYSNVIGSEKTALQAAIDADATLDKSDKDKIDAATKVLDDARTAFTGAKSSYDAYVAAKAVDYEDNKPYADPAKYTAIGTAQAAAAATSASDAEAKTAAIISAYRKYLESHALAEGVAGAENKTSLISDPNLDVTISEMTAGAWAFTQSGGTVQIADAESFTDGANNSDYKYFDYNNGDHNSQLLTQTISGLPAGNYLLTVTARAKSNFNNYFYLNVVDGSNNFREKIPAIGNTGGIFDRGWNDVNLEFNHYADGDVTIEVYSDGGSGSGKRSGWWDATRFRLVRLGGATYPLTIGALDWATLYTPYALDFSGVAGLTAYTASVSGSTVTLNAVDDVPANTGVVLNGEEGSYNVPVITSSTEEQGALTGNAAAATAYNAFDGYTLYALAQAEDPAHKVQFRPVSSGSIAAGKAFLKIASGGSVKAFTVEFADADGIKVIDNGQLTLDNAEIYNLAGQRMSKLQKGVNIVNGKKVLVK